MALFQCDFYSEVLDLCSSMSVILPQESPSDGVKEKKYKVLYLLHGLCDDHTMWLRMTSIERYVKGMNLAVVMPAVNRSFYTDMRYGGKYWTFISDELPKLARSFFPLSDRRENNFVAGISMGGYGAFKLALRNPDKYAAAASISGVLDIVNLDRTKVNVDYDAIFGEHKKLSGSDEDIFHLAGKVFSSTGPKPRLYQCCGTEDFLYGDNIRFRDFCRKLQLECTYEEELGAHEWGYWDKKIPRVLEWLNVN